MALDLDASHYGKCRQAGSDPPATEEFPPQRDELDAGSNDASSDGQSESKKPYPVRSDNFAPLSSYLSSASRWREMTGING
jgi:hypothetical protein